MSDEIPCTAFDSVSTTAPRLRDQCASRQLRFTRCGAASRSHSGSSRATMRAKSCVVSTSSKTITHGGAFFARADEGCSAKRVSFAPR